MIFKLYEGKRRKVTVHWKYFIPNFTPEFQRFPGVFGTESDEVHFDKFSARLRSNP